MSLPMLEREKNDEKACLVALAKNGFIKSFRKLSRFGCWNIPTQCFVQILSPSARMGGRALMKSKQDNLF